MGLRCPMWTTIETLVPGMMAGKNVVEKGFVTRGADGTIDFSEQQKRRIINL
jgi:hypothetical protein